MFCFLQNVKKNKTNDNRKEEKNRKQINFNIRIEWHLEANTNLEEHKMVTFWGARLLGTDCDVF